MFFVKYWAFKYVVDVVCTVFRVDIIIMFKFVGVGGGVVFLGGEED